MLKQRIITALILVLALGGVLFFMPAEYVWIVLAGVVALAAWEWAGLMGVAAGVRIIYGALLFFVCVLFHFYLQHWTTAVLGTAAIFWLMIVPVWLRAQWRLANRPLLGMLLGLGLLLATWIAFCLIQSRSSLLLLAVMAIVWVADVAAYFAGRQFGRHKLAPSISPGKTWEGVGGAITGVCMYGALIINASPIGERWQLGVVVTSVLFLALTAVSVIGDLFESLLKRQAQIKDSSNLLPGHGGVLDRIDSLISTLLIAALIVHSVI